MELIVRLAGGLGARIVTDSKAANEFRFSSAAEMQLFCECVIDMGWFPCDDWLLMTVLVVKEKPIVKMTKAAIAYDSELTSRVE